MTGRAADEKGILRAVYTVRLRKGAAAIDDISLVLRESSTDTRRRLEEAAREGLVEMSGQLANLTAKGRARLKVVMIGGAFEIIHPGHVHTVAEAKSLGDTLVVVLAADRTVFKNKGREPVTPQDLRVELVSALRDVDVAIPGGEGSIYDTLDRVRPNIVALGYDQRHRPEDIENEAKRRGMEVSVVALTSPMPGIKTSKIVRSL